MTDDSIPAPAGVLAETREEFTATAADPNDGHFRWLPDRSPERAWASEYRRVQTWARPPRLYRRTVTTTAWVEVPDVGDQALASDPASSIPLDALKVIAQGEPLNEVAGDYGVPLDVVKAAAPLAGRTFDPDVCLCRFGQTCHVCAENIPQSYSAVWGSDVDSPARPAPEDTAPSEPIEHVLTPGKAGQNFDKAALVLLTRLVELRRGNGCVEGWVDRWETAWSDAGALLAEVAQS